MVGSTISHYKILAKLGEGGMGVVYKAEDTRLKRTVALKFLPKKALGDEEHKDRFFREAQAAASLDHPNICTVYEIGEAADETFISMAYVAGESLRDRTAAGPLKLEEALDIVVGIGQGLQEAHEHQVVHRDIKSANILLTEKGEPKITDFGLAHLSDRSTLTKAGTTLGTPAYMSPEQALGQRADRRSDVWSLGVVLYEMVTGRLPFEGDQEQVIIYEIINEPHEPVTGRRAGLPLELDRILGKALAKSSDERYQHVEEMIVDLRALEKQLASGEPPGPAQRATQTELAAAAPSARWKLAVPWIFMLAVLVGIVALAVSLRSPKETQPPRPVRFSFTPGTDVADPVISPNGQHIAYLAGDEETKLWVQDLDQQEPRELVAARSGAHTSLFWSPDSDFVGFIAGGELKKIPARGGPATLLCRLPGPAFWGGAWSPNRDTIVFAAGTPPSLYKVASAGGTPELLIEGGEVVPHTPNFLPREHGKRLLLVGGLARGGVFYNLDTGEEEIWVGGSRHALAYSPSGHVLEQRGMAGPSSRVWARPISTDKLTPTAEPFLVAESASYPSVSGDGTLVYLDRTGRDWQLVWRDRSGDKVGLIGQSQPFMFDPELSPDGRRVAVRAYDPDSWNLWVHDVDRPLKTRLTFEEDGARSPLWSPSGSQISFFLIGENEDDRGIFSLPADGSGEAINLVPSYEGGFPLDWSADGKYLLVNAVGSNQAYDIEYLKPKDDNSGYEVVTFLEDPFVGIGAQFSRDGHFVAYSSNASGRYEVYVRRFPDGGGKQRLSQNGGWQPRWSRNGKELFYVEGDWLVVIPITTSPSFSVGPPRRLFRSAALLKAGLEGFAYANPFDVSPDGKRFVIAEPIEDAPPPTIRVVQNWVEAFRGGEQD